MPVSWERSSDVKKLSFLPAEGQNFYGETMEASTSRSLYGNSTYVGYPPSPSVEVAPGEGVFSTAASNYLRVRRNSSTNLQAQLDGVQAFELTPTFEEPPNRYARRKSVFAEQYDPEEDDDDEVEKKVYPKTDEQRKRLGEAVKSILLFRSLDKEQMQEVLDAMFERKVEPGETVIRQGDDGDNFYVIEHGVYNIHVNTDQEKDKLVGKYDNTGSFGELALMYNMPRAATIISATEGSLWAMNRQTFRRIVLKSAFKKRKEYEQLLESVPMLQSLESYERMNLADALMPKQYDHGELIIRQGDEADGMYFIESGTVRITVINKNANSQKIEESSDKGEEVEVNRLTKGQYIGELALVTHKPRAASAYADGIVKLAFLDVQAFERLLGPCMSIMQRNINNYDKQLVQIFGSKANMSDLRR